MRSARGLYVDGQDGISTSDPLYRLTGRSEKERSHGPTAHVICEEKVTRGGLRLIATVNMASGTFTRFDSQQIGVMQKFQQKFNSFVEKSATVWQSLPSRIRFAIIISGTLLLGILIGLLIQSHQFSAPFAPVWKSFSL